MIKELPLVIDPHVHFRVPGAEHKEDWTTASAAALSGGVGMVFDMPNNNPSITSLKLLEEKNNLIKKQINPQLKYKLYFGATANNSEEIKKLKNNNLVCGVKVFMNQSTGDLLVQSDQDLIKIFAAAKEANKIVSVHAEDDTVQRAIDITKQVGNKLYICHVSSKQELDLAKQARQEGLEIYMEVCTHHLFLSQPSDHQVKPPIRTQADVNALWEAINDGTIDTLGTDHAPHTLAEKASDNPPAGLPGIETLLPLMLDAVNKEKLTLERLTELTHYNIKKIFQLEVSGTTTVDMDLTKRVDNNNLKTKCGWSPYHGWVLKGWPIKINEQ